MSAPCVEWINSITANKVESGNVITFTLYDVKMNASSSIPSKSSEMPPPALPLPSHGPSSSVSTPSSVRSFKRLSLHFPAQNSDGIRRQKSSTISSSPQSLSHPPSPDTQKPASTDSNTFLTALAAQERRVLELKEELEKAEGDLLKLKKQWALHEASKKRSEIRHVEQLRLLPSPSHSTSEKANEGSRVSREEERWRAMYFKTRQPQRKVFEGGRHTRALSLLSPTSLANRGVIINQIGGIDSGIMDGSVRCVPNSAVSETLSGTSHIRGQQSHGTRDDLVNTGKQLVGDLREGLWTFIEDLRQATVGDEAVTEARSRQLQDSGTAGMQTRNNDRIVQQRTPNRASMPPRKRPTMVDSLIEAQNPTPMLIDLDDSPKISSHETSSSQQLVGNDQPCLSDTSTKVKIPAADTEEDNFGWDNWEDSPPAKSPGSPGFSTGTAVSSPRTSMRFVPPPLRL